MMTMKTIEAYPHVLICVHVFQLQATSSKISTVTVTFARLHTDRNMWWGAPRQMGDSGS